MAEPAAQETFGFRAEVEQLLHLMVHSLYSNREIFLRELVSNASDANDRLRFEALSRPELAEGTGELEIRLSLDKEARTITVTDTGIGMSRDEVIEQLGTLAHSGTRRHIEQLTGDQKKDSQLIGQFGVGFYSAFIVADEVTVESRRADLPSDQGVEWRSTGKGEYSVRASERAERGTSVRLQLTEAAAEFLEPERIRSLVRRYSDHIAFPIFLDVAGEAAAAEPVNRAKALWMRPRTEIDEGEYKEFYRHITHDFTDPLCYSHNRVEGRREYTSLLYVPAVAPFDLWNREAPRGVKLYVQRVFITDDAAEFLPLYLRFVRGVVDSADLSLNVSREMLQQDPAIAAIRSALTRRVLDMLTKLAKDDAEKYATFWQQFGSTLKEGLAEDSASRDAIVALLRFHTTRSTGTAQDRSLSDYVADAAPEQDKIYYLVAESPAMAAASPHLEVFAEHDIEVVLLTDRIDEWALQYLTEYEGKVLKDVTRGALELPASAASPDIAVANDKEHNDLLKRIKRALRDRVAEVRPSARLKESAACIVLGDEDVGYQMRELLKAAGHEAPAAKPNLEVNLAHPLLERMAAEQDQERFERLAALALDQAMLAEGRPLDDPGGFVRRLNELMFGS